jgi:hypothetical protein
VETVDPGRDALLVAAAQLQVVDGWACPVIVDLGVFSMIECVEARDSRLGASPGAWFGKVPKVLSTASRKLLRDGRLLTSLDESAYLRDTNFGKLNRIPHRPLLEYLRKHGYSPAGSGMTPIAGMGVALVAIAAATRVARRH